MKTKLKIVKIGGNLIDDAEVLATLLKDFSAIKEPKILIHGGGKIATATSKKLGIESKLVEGRRITSAEDLEVITMVYAGLLNKNIVAQLQANNCNALGLSGADANCVQANLRHKEPVDYGFVGDVNHINSAIIQQLLTAQLTPVFCAISHDGKGQLLNTNADTVTAEIAIAMSKYYEVELMYCFEKNGVLENVEDENSVIPKINTAKYEALKANQQIHQGMLPKMQNCFYALKNGVANVVIGSSKLLQSNSTLFTQLSL
ncbi:N-acetylglutamate kinase [Mesonia phycicola]|uniref:Acetylglutamate kinase n=1 Tax=Mesonia phycicola TaxID=579105 RepID=A0A1M6AID0_9FLAO|nr:acetylglutamate kinase [Mesonia phycicola]SHI36260.1 N-acetylglutamate kinase [Mesonia phycicola]